MKFYCTFGFGQAYQGRVMPIIANDERQAREYMFSRFGGAWCTSYDEEGWKAIADDPERWWPLEAELPTVDLTKGVTDFVTDNGA